MQAASVLLHELAHIAGAPRHDDDPQSLAAGTALKHCGLKKYSQDDARGALDRHPDQKPAWRK
jgi:hypothetical protein